MTTASQKILQNQLKDMKRNPVKGFCVDLPEENNIYYWKVFIEGPPDTDYFGGIFQADMHFPQDYPFSPPTLKFTSDFWHPNVYKDGKVCISILHPPGDDPMSGERPEERWLPTQTPETILLSVISLLADPNISSPANVDASVEFRKQRDAYKKRVKKLVDKSLKEVPEGFEFPEEKPMRPEIKDDPVDLYYEEQDEVEFYEESDPENSDTNISEDEVVSDQEGDKKE